MECFNWVNLMFLLENFFSFFCLTSTWSHNLKVILRYMLIMITLSPCELLPYAKKIILYMCKNHEERLLNELLNELQIAESLNISLERTDTLPFFRSNNSSTTLTNTSTNSTQFSGTNSVRKSLNSHESRGFIHTKRHHSGEDHLQHDHISYTNTLRIRSPSQNSLSTSLTEKLSAIDVEKGQFVFSSIADFKLDHSNIYSSSRRRIASRTITFGSLRWDCCTIENSPTRSIDPYSMSISMQYRCDVDQ